MPLFRDKPGFEGRAPFRSRTCSPDRRIPHLIVFVNDFERHIVARLLEFFGPALHWNRSLWSIGTSLALSEVLEASEASRAGILGPDSINSAIGTATRLIARDSGISDSHRELLQQALNPGGSKSHLRYEGLDYRVIERTRLEIDQTYLERWADAIGQAAVGPERAARAIAAHLLDQGFSAGFMHRWWTYQVKYEQGQSSLADIVRRASARAKEPHRQFDVMIAFPSRLESSSKKGFTVPRRWLEAPAVSEWLRCHGFPVEEVKQQGGLLLTATEKDPEAAAEAAAEVVNVFAARVLVSLNKEIRPLPFAWVAGTKKPFGINRQTRGVHVGAVHRENRVWLESEADEVVDPAIELLAPLQSSSPGAAVAGGWAAVEALLSEPDNRAAAADRLATIVACSFPRAELTMLSYVAQDVDGPIAERLRERKENRDRAVVVAEAIATGQFPDVGTPADSAAVARMRSVLSNPKAKLTDVQTHASDTFRRLYRQRNLVLHGGRTSAVALRACLRTAAPLVGAGIDRVVHARYVDKLRPLELAARAKIGLGKIGPGTPSACVDLLGR